MSVRILVLAVVSLSLLASANVGAQQNGGYADQPQRSAADTPSANTANTRAIQNELGRLGYYKGPMDGRGGAQTQDAIRRYQHDKGLPVDGQPSTRLWSFMQSSSRQGYRGATSLDEAHQNMNRNGTICCR